MYYRNAEFPFDIGHWLLRMSTWTHNPHDAFYSHKHMFLPRTNAFFSLVIFPNQLSKTNLVAFLCIETTTARVRALLTSGTRHGRVQTAKQTSICCDVITSIPLTQFSYKKPNTHLAVVEEDWSLLTMTNTETPKDIKLPLLWTEQRTWRFIWEYFITSFENVIFPLLLRFP